MTDESEVDYDRLREGLCPIHGTSLELRDGHGWCPECRMGWSMTTDTISTHLNITGFTLDGIHHGPARVRFDRPTPHPHHP